MGSSHFSHDTLSYAYVRELSTSYSSVTVTYDQDCARYRNETDDLRRVTNEYYSPSITDNGIGNCSYGNVQCTYKDPKEILCRLNFRMQAGLTLAGCLVIKAAYMVLYNLRGRLKVKSHCLTFGDVLVASSLDPGARIGNECMVSGGEGRRHLVSHSCHKHCKDPRPSATGDGIGHCQNCKKFNTTDKAADLLHPVISVVFPVSGTMKLLTRIIDEIQKELTR